jgi:hypothetical protein
VAAIEAIEPLRLPIAPVLPAAARRDVQRCYRDP